MHVKMIARRRFQVAPGEGYLHAITKDAGDEIIVPEQIFLDAMDKGFKTIKDDKTGIETRKPTSAMLNHCRVVECSEDVKEKYAEFRGEQGIEPYVAMQEIEKIKTLAVAEPASEIEEPQTEDPGEPEDQGQTDSTDADGNTADPAA
jgi:hypothetical protein